jgi:hypothetical protein
MILMLLINGLKLIIIGHIANFVLHIVVADKYG